MKRFLVYLIGLALIADLVSDASTVSAHPPLPHSGDGSVRDGRLPWLDGQQREHTQGWGGATTHTGTLYYATDWAAGSAFAIRAVTEGDAQCLFLDENGNGVSDDGFGYRVTVDSINSSYYDLYAHLPTCPFTGTKHFEQGDFISNSGCSGSCTGNHLHYQEGNVTIVGGIFKYIGQSVASCLSQFCDFADTVYGDGQLAGDCVSGECDEFVSDNAGPGEGASSTAKTKIRNAYVNKGHYLCGGVAWNCFGSSIVFIGESQGRKAAQSCLGSPSDCGWNQISSRTKSTTSIGRRHARPSHRPTGFPTRPSSPGSITRGWARLAQPSPTIRSWVAMSSISATGSRSRPLLVERQRVSTHRRPVLA